MESPPGPRRLFVIGQQAKRNLLSHLPASASAARRGGAVRFIAHMEGRGRSSSRGAAAGARRGGARVGARGRGGGTRGGRGDRRGNGKQPARSPSGQASSSFPSASGGSGDGGGGGGGGAGGGAGAGDSYDTLGKLVSKATKPTRETGYKRLDEVMPRI